MHRASYEGEQSRGGASRRSSDESRGVQAFVDQEVAKRDEQWTAQVARIMENAKVERETAANEIAALRRQVQALSGNLARGADSRGAPGGPLSAPLSQQWQNWDLPGDGAERTHRGTDGSMSSEPDTVPPVPYPISTGTHAEVSLFFSLPSFSVALTVVLSAYALRFPSPPAGSRELLLTRSFVCGSRVLCGCRSWNPYGGAVLIWMASLNP